MGGDFGDLAAEGLVRALSGNLQVGVALLDETNYTTFYPMVPRAISSNVEVRHLAHPLRNVVIPLGMQFFQAEVEGVDFEAQEVQTAHGIFPYDYLVLAPGSRTAFFDTRSVIENAIDFKGLRLKELGHNLNRAQVVSDWIVDLFIRPNISKLMEEE